MTTSGHLADTHGLTNTVVYSHSADTVAVGSGRADSVDPIASGSARGQTWRTACGYILTNMDERRIQGETTKSTSLDTLYQVVHVAKAVGRCLAHATVETK